MTDKDPKDMTASELLRNTASSIETHQRSLEYLNMADSINLLREMFCVVENETSYSIDLANTLVAIADKIDAELSEARKDAIRESKKPMWWFRNAIKCGYDWPEPRDGEKFRDYLHRCFLPRPRFEDGEVVGVREYEDIQGYCVYDDGEFFVTTPNRSIDYAAGERVERPAPEALGADGMPIKDGETVWLDEAHSRCAGSCGFEDGNKYSLCGIERQEMLTVEDAHIEVDGREYVRVCTCGAWCHASWLTHTPTDTQEQIDEDVAKSTFEYWGCQNAPCGNCPALVGGEKPFKRFGTEDCQKAMVSDLLLRQRELDARKGGE